MEMYTQLERDVFLKHLLETVKESRRVVSMFEIGEKLGFTEQKTKLIVQYFEGEGLVEWRTREGVCLTHQGFKAAVALSKPGGPDMTRRRASQPPSIEPKVFASLEEIESGITKFRRRLKELDELDPQTVRYDDQRVRNIESNIRNTILEVFGPNSPEFEEHQCYRIWHGPDYVDQSEDSCQQSFAANVPESKSMVEGLISRLEEKKLDFSSSKEIRRPTGSGVFLVHGRNEARRETVARFLEHLDLRVIILHEQPDRGRTIIEKFEDHSKKAGFAVVLLTGDDRGGLKEEDPSTYRLRARQNVILELGFFLGALGRDRVCALYEEGVDIPSDYQGVLFTKLDSDWKLRLARELKEGGLPVDLNKALS